MPLLFPALALFLVAGCAGTSGAVRFDDVNRRIDVFGVSLGSDVDLREIDGAVATEEPCLRGYERIFDALDIAVGYGRDRRIRKITTRNRRTSMFGISPGDSFLDGRAMIVREGFKEFDTPYRFRDDRLSITLLVDGAGTVFGMTLETSD